VKIYVNRTPIKGPWGGGAHFVNAFHSVTKESGHELIPPDSMSVSPDVLLLAGLDNDGRGISVEQAINYKWMMAAQDRNVKLVLRVNECDARKNTRHVDPYLLKLFPHMDGIVFVSQWLKQYFSEKGWNGKNDCVIINGVDKEIFQPMPKLNNGKLNIVAHHWSDNRMKGADTYEKLDRLVGKHPDRFAFTYIGRHKCSFSHTTVVAPLSGKSLGEELGKHDVYVSASIADPGPNHCLEALACGLPTLVHVDGGGCCEFAGQECTFETWEQLETMLNHGLPKQNPIQLVDWETCIKQYLAFLLQTKQKGS